MAADFLTVPAPAKLNIDLRVLSRRADGMHEINSVMTLVDFCDSVVVSRRADGKLRRAWSHPQVGDNDLCMRAAALLKQTSGSSEGADITVQKRIPVGGGLGGGSSNAASVLLALNHLWKTKLRRRQLMSLAARLGADVPFFIFGRAARARGIGERLTAVKTAFLQKHLYYVLVFPKVVSATAAVYAEYENLTLGLVKRKITPVLINNTNNLAEAVFNLHPQIVAAAETLRQAAGEVRLSGSGACVFAAFDNKATAAAVCAKISPTTTATVATSLPRHPICACLS
ncbi:MAG: 4-(cytidine 5'-diphospho)-2-C-methyl-D-erythritol kinase [Gammaproteobacteria bacterium WSBS_2016_MAG_OTU1]